MPFIQISLIVVYMTKHIYKLATLFSGAGGLDSGFVKTGMFENQIANDILPTPAKTYSKNHHSEIQTVDEFNENPKIPCYIVGDVSKVNFEPLSDIDCVIGGSPCQDFSQARGNREDLGIKMVRGSLYSHFVRALIKSNPKMFVFENVPGLTSTNDGNAYKAIVKDFENLNTRAKGEFNDVIDNVTIDINSRDMENRTIDEYIENVNTDTQSDISAIQNATKNYFLIFNGIVDSSCIGVPQKRKRLIIVGVRRDLVSTGAENALIRKSRKVLTGRESLLSKYPLSAMEAFEGKTILDLAEKYADIMNEYAGMEKDVRTFNSAKWKSDTWDNLTFDVTKDYLTANGIKPKNDVEIKNAFAEHERVLVDFGYYGKSLRNVNFDDGSNEIPKENDAVIDRMRHIPPDMNHLFVDGTQWSVKGTMSNIYRRTHPLKPGYTVMAYGGGGTWSYHYERNRSTLTNRERARLQTFSDDYMFEGNRSQVRAQIGEAVPVRLGTKLAEIALSVLERF